MTEKEDLQTAFIAGFVTSRKAGFTSSGLHSVTKKAALSQFDRWHDMEYNND